MPSSIPLLSADEAARQLGVTKQTVSKLIRDGKLIAQRVGNKWVIPEDNLRVYLEENNLVPEPEDHHRLNNTVPNIIALSFFSGALGLDLGMEQAGIEAMLYCENDRKCRMTINAMKPDAALVGDISKLRASQILDLAGVPSEREVDIIFGGPPCQAFSTAGARRAFDDARGNVFIRYLELIAEIRPRYAVIENVRGLLSTPYPLEKGGEPVKGGAMKLVLSHLEKAGYVVSFNLYNAANFGAPQIRERVVIIAKRDGEKVPYLEPTNSSDGSFDLPLWRTLGDAIQNMPPSPCHHSEFPEKRLRFFKLLKEGQYWKDLPLDLQREAMGKSYNLSGGKTGFYRRLSFDKPCPTLVTSPTMPATDLCHPTEDRPLSTEEYRRIQGFPDDWKICGNITDVYRQIGNAVPIALGKAIGKAILDDMEGASSGSRYEGFPYSRYKHTSDSSWHVGA